jgi:PadR family transcriptional regulator AphA
LITFNKERYVTASEVAKRLQIARSTCYNNVLPLLTACYLPGRKHPVYRQSEVEELSQVRTVEKQVQPLAQVRAEEGLAARHVEKQEGKPEKSIYTLTEQGKEGLRDWLSESVEPGIERNELLLKLFFGAHIPLEKNKKHLHAFQELQSHLLAKYEGIERELLVAAQDDATLWYRLLTVRYGIHRCRAFLTWCDETLGTLHLLAQRERTAPQEVQDSMN